MKPLPTDLEILEAIYDRYYDDFQSFTVATPDRPAKNYVPIDIPALASKLRVNPDIVFGRLYFHLQAQHGFELVDGTNKIKVPFFTKSA